MRTPQETNMIPEWLIDKIGYDDWVEFCDTFGGQHWWIPTTPSNIERDAQIKRLYYTLIKTPGTKLNIIYAKLAEQFNISKSSIKRIVR